MLCSLWQQKAIEEGRFILAPWLRGNAVCSSREGLVLKCGAGDHTALQSGAENGQEVGLGSDLKARLQGPITSSSKSPPPEGLTAFLK